MNPAAKYQIKRSEDARNKVLAYMQLNPCSSAKECALSLGMKYQTVAKYIREARRSANNL